MNQISAPINGIIRGLEAVPLAAPAFVLRLGVALAFWRSGNVKLASWEELLDAAESVAAKST